MASVTLTVDGFAVMKGVNLISQVRWMDVEQVVAFKLDLGTTDCICLGFRTGDWITHVKEEMGGYTELVEAMQREFPDYEKDWWCRVAFPAFATNYTTVWERRRS